jgi:hypothetical protein
MLWWMLEVFGFNALAENYLEGEDRLEYTIIGESLDVLPLKICCSEILSSLKRRTVLFT